MASHPKLSQEFTTIVPQLITFAVVPKTAYPHSSFFYSGFSCHLI